MQLGLLGPAIGHLDALERAAKFLYQERKAERVVYLSDDAALDEIVEGWAERLVGKNAGEEELLSRATERCLSATPDEINAFLQKERERGSLKVFESLPGESTRAIEILSGKVAVMIYDKAYLDEEDILPATVLVFGKSEDPLVRRVGRRWFLAPGSFDKAGVMLLDDQDSGIHVTLFNEKLEVSRRERLSTGRGVKLRVSGADT
jgi:hypothetical protein